MDAEKKDIDEQSLSGTTIAASTLSEDTIVPPTNTISTELEHHFFKGNGLTSKATVRSTHSNEYRLVADIHRTKPSTIQMFDSKDTKAPPLGTLEFPATHNNFQIRAGSSQQLIQVRARVGHPHPSSYSFPLPATKTSSPQTVTWTKFDAQSNRTGYHLRSNDGTNALLASWYLVRNQKHQAVLKWHIEPRDEVMEAVVVLSFVGALSRLKLKGKDDSETPSQLARWNGMWFMAILGTAAVA